MSFGKFEARVFGRRASLGAINPYLIGVLAVIGSALIQAALDPVVHIKGPFLFFTTGLTLAALAGGLRAGITATVLSVPVSDYFFIDPRFSIFIDEDPGDLILLGLFTCLGVGISFIVERLRRSRERLFQSLQALENSESTLRVMAAAIPGVLFTAAPDGQCDYISPHLPEYSGLEMDQLLGYGWRALVHPDDAAAVTFLAEDRPRADFEVELRLRGRDGGYRWFKCRATPRSGPGGAIVKWTGVCADIDQQKRLEQELQARSRELARSNEDLMRFSHAASHDLQAPLRTIGIFTQLLLEKNRGRLDADSERIARFIRNGLDRMENLIRDLLQYAMAGQEAAGTRGPVDLNEVVETVQADLHAEIEEAGVTIECAPLPTVAANRQGMLSVFQNLIGNAIKYRGSEPLRILIRAAAGAGEWIISVQDNGMGFESHYADRIFEMFQRLSPKIKGTGIGLATVRRVVERHDGRTWAESEPGQGATFFFTLPRAQAMSAAQEENAHC